MRKAFLIMLLVSACLLAATGCGKRTVNYEDGTYTGISSVFTNDDGTDDGNGYGVVTVTFKDNAVADCVYRTFEENGKLKDRDYGKKGGVIANRDYYNKAQKAIAACDEYASQLIQNGGLDGIDAISGATINYNEFVEAAKDALGQAAVSDRQP